MECGQRKFGMRSVSREAAKTMGHSMVLTVVCMGIMRLMNRDPGGGDSDNSLGTDGFFSPPTPCPPSFALSTLVSWPPLLALFASRNIHFTVSTGSQGGGRDLHFHVPSMIQITRNHYSLLRNLHLIRSYYHPPVRRCYYHPFPSLLGYPIKCPHTAPSRIRAKYIECKPCRASPYRKPRMEISWMKFARMQHSS